MSTVNCIIDKARSTPCHVFTKCFYDGCVCVHTQHDVDHFTTREHEIRHHQNCAKLCSYWLSKHRKKSATFITDHSVQVTMVGLTRQSKIETSQRIVAYEAAGEHFHKLSQR